MARRTAQETRAAILATAMNLFRERGYATTSVRDIAAGAHTDPALVIRHFGSKESLFLEVVGTDALVRPLSDGPLETLGVDTIRTVLRTDERVRAMVLHLLHAGGSTGVAARLRALHETELVHPLRDRLVGPDADVRARLAAALVGGLIYSLWVVGDRELLAAGDDVVVARYGALLQELILPGTTSGSATVLPGGGS